jgi:hypothetical protein
LQNLPDSGLTNVAYKLNGRKVDGVTHNEGENDVYKVNPSPNTNGRTSGKVSHKNSVSGPGRPTTGLELLTGQVTEKDTSELSQSRQVGGPLHTEGKVIEDYSLVPAWAIALIVLLLVVVVVAVIMVMY